MSHCNTLVHGDSSCTACASAAVVYAADGDIDHRAEEVASKVSSRASRCMGTILVLCTLLCKYFGYLGWYQEVRGVI